MSTSETGKSKRSLTDRLTLADFRARMLDVKFNWGTTPGDRKLTYSCDDFIPLPATIYYRAMDIDAPPEIVYRWMCQLRVAPYSYDYMDNYCRRSPRHLIDGLDDLEAGQEFITIFELVTFDPGKEFSIRNAKAKWFWGPHIGCSYRFLPRGENGCRVAFKSTIYIQPGGYPRLRRKFFPWLELLMLHKQLSTFKKLAEKQAREQGVPTAARIDREPSATLP